MAAIEVPWVWPHEVSIFPDDFIAVCPRCGRVAVVLAADTHPILRGKTMRIPCPHDDPDDGFD